MKKNIFQTHIAQDFIKYCLKLDIKKFYPNIDHEILKGLLRRKIKDKDFNKLNFEIIKTIHKFSSNSVEN